MGDKSFSIFINVSEQNIILKSQLSSMPTISMFYGIIISIILAIMNTTTLHICMRATKVRVLQSP
jgi:hypothetical protein